MHRIPNEISKLYLDCPEKWATRKWLWWYFFDKNNPEKEKHHDYYNYICDKALAFDLVLDEIDIEKIIKKQYDTNQGNYRKENITSQNAL
mgnify:CR=1 FL=1